MLRNKFLSDIYRLFSKEGIRYVCIGNAFYESVCEEGDIDLIIHPHDISRAYTIVDNTLLSNPEVFFVPCPAPSNIKLGSIKYFVTGNELMEPVLQLDLAVSFHWRGLEFLSYSSIQKKTRIDEDGVVKLQVGVDVLIGALKDIAYNRPIKPKRIDGGYSISNLLNLLTELGASKRGASRFLQAYQNDKNIFFPFIQLWFSMYRFSKLSGIFSYVLSLIRCYGPFSQREVIAAFYGPDGAGKSSIIKHLVESSIIGELFDDICVKHTRPHALPPLSWYLKPFSSHEERLMGQPSRSVIELSRLKSIIFVAYYSLDYFLGRVISIKDLFSRSKRLIVFDRYAFEFGYQQTFGQLPNFMIHLTKLVYKKPLLNTFVFADPSIIKQRKDELSEVDIQYQIDKYKEVDIKYKVGSYFLDTSKNTIEDGAVLVLAELFRRIK